MVIGADSDLKLVLERFVPLSDAIAHAPKGIRMKTATRIIFGFFMICATSRNGILFAQVSEHDTNLDACKSGVQSCDPTLLTSEQSNELRAEAHRRNVICNQSALTEQETIALAVANHQHNVLAFMDGFGACNHAMLTPKEAIVVAAAERQRNITRCMNGRRHVTVPS
jgi:hypothetical protein